MSCQNNADKMDERLTLYGVEHSYRYRKIFEGIELVLTPGDVLAITGVNGSGKSTLLKILAGMLQPTGGKVELAISGKVISSEQHPLHIGLVGPYVNAYQDLTLRENLEFLRRARSMRVSVDYTENIVSEVGLSAHIDQPLKTYSTGMLQRVRFAAALFHAPRILLLDEPTLGLDAQGRKMVGRFVGEAQESGHLVAIASNEGNETAWANQFLRIDDYTRRPATVAVS